MGQFFWSQGNERRRTDSELIVTRHYEGDPHRTLARWIIPRRTWASWRRDYAFRQRVQSDPFVVPFRRHEFPFRFDLYPNGWTEEQKTSESYGLNLQLDAFPTLGKEVIVNYKMTLQEFPSHSVKYTRTLTKAHSYGPGRGLGRHSDIDAIHSDVLTLTMDVRIQPLPNPVLNVTRDYEGDPHRTLAEWVVPRQTWESWRRNYAFGRRVSSDPFVVPFRRHEFPFRFDLDPNGWTEEQKTSESYGLCLLLDAFPTAGKEVTVNYKMTLQEFPSHSYENTSIFTKAQSCGPRPGLGRHSDIGAINSDVLTFALDVCIETTVVPTPSAMRPSPAFESKEEESRLRTMESNWTAVFTRTDARRLIKVLTDAEEPLRSDVSELMYFNEHSRVFRAFVRKKALLEKTLGALAQIYDDEIDRCRSDPDYFKEIVIFAKHTRRNKIFHNVLQIYGSTQENYIFGDPVEWNTRIDELTAISKTVKAAYRRRVLCQPMKGVLDMYPHVVVTQNRMRLLLTNLASGLEADRLYLKGFKSLSRIWEKMALHPTRRWDSDVWDMSRGLISFDTLAEIVSAVERLRGNPQIEIINVWNRFGRERKDEWQDVMVHIRFRDQPTQFRVISEIQLSLQHLTVARRDLGGHEQYSKFRSAKEVMRFVDNNGEMEAAIQW